MLLLHSAKARIRTQMKNAPKNNCFTHVFLQAGVGSFAGGIAAALVNATKSGCPYMTSLPKIVVVEPSGAHCFYLSHNKKDGNLHGKKDISLFSNQLRTFWVSMVKGTYYKYN